MARLWMVLPELLTLARYWGESHTDFCLLWLALTDLLSTRLLITALMMVMVSLASTR